MQEKLSLWQQRLDLDTWSIRIVMAHTNELRPDTLGNVHWDTAKKTALIRLLHPADYHMNRTAMIEDMECTIVHELVHLALSSLPRTDASRMEEERAVNQITDALLRLDRQVPNVVAMRGPSVAARPDGQ